MKNILIIGATSAIAAETARIYAEQGCTIFLAGRSAEKLIAVRDDLRVHGARKVDFKKLDLMDCDGHKLFLDEVWQALGTIDLLLIAHGLLGDQQICEADFAAARTVIDTNFLSVASLLTHAANRFEQQGNGCIAVISSVAGDRGRQSNYVYGSAKGALSVFLAGLRNRLYRSGIHVLTIKPGFVSTPMTAHLSQGPLFVKPAIVARGIVKAVEKRKNEAFFPFYWRWIILIIRSIPEGIFKKLNL